MKTQGMNLKQRLTEHFTLREMIASGTAISKGIRNLPTPEVVDNLRALCENVLEPLRRRFGVIRVTSGFRCPELNKAVHGVKNSQHMRGEAADLHVTSLKQARRMMAYVQLNLDFDQLLLEQEMSTGCCWIHVSYVAQPGRRDNRKMVREVRVKS